MSITGLILAGGKGSRMGGVDKGWVIFNQKPMIAHVIQRLAVQVDHVMISANREIERYQTLGYPVIEDDMPDFSGPLAGVHQGMLSSKDAYILTVPCDAPLLPNNLADRLMDALTRHDADLAVAKTGDQLQPVFCLYRRHLIPSLETYLNNGGRKVETWQNSLQYVTVAFDDNLRAFSNINTKDELSVLENT
ncbi:molybdenum cofactor guanylyltransferase MobA [Methylovorus sp. MM2]|uniref:molybdenum cofactor guanylyltransferase MobA n=1 Tax=Methylovorus sp. MM2 TaxID=1848038 RepID=UPI0007DF8C09|nr:molybdenum cofactor guanylyltransferase MobA [Methylovorus sp. MM2]OAM52297.1 molybdenum cofactor guanylyltransferase MobA [Methylovorus sp. MM2]